MKSSVILRRAHDALVKHGWCQQNYVDTHGHICLVEALFHVVDRRQRWQRDGSPMAAYRVLSRVIGNDHLALWNDEKERTLPEILAALEAAAVIADEQERAQVGEDLAATV
jgi:hypothetical protein